MTNPGLFILAVLAVLATPGPTNTLLASAAAVSGIRASLMLLMAELTGYLTTVLLVGLLLRPLLEAFPRAAAVLKVAVALYLAYMAFRLWRRSGDLGAVRGVIGFRAVFLATMLNPKGLIFALAMIPLGSPAVALYLLAFAAAVPTMGLLWLAGGRVVGAAVGEKRRLVPRAASVALVGFAGLIAASAFG
ncbi:MAG: LysE family transporter [Devosia sp.]